MKPLSTLSPTAVRAFRGVFTDIDGTLTDAHGRIPSSAFKAMESLQENGLRLVVVTGRPAGWCDLIARTWPVDAVVGENGGLWFRRDGEKMVRHYRLSAEERRINRQKLDGVAEEVLREVPGTALASDQPYREFDLAVDFCEDVAPLGEDAVQGIVGIFQRHGAVAKVSNIHVNGWFGAYDKATMCRDLVASVWKEDLEQERERWTFFGDSPNDVPLFRFFPHSIGVANLRRFASHLEALPGYITRADGAAGFCEGTRVILRRKGK